MLPVWITDKKETEVFKSKFGDKLSKLDDTGADRLTMFLAQWSVDLGLVNGLDTFELTYIENWIKENYPELTINQFELAKKLALTRQLDCNPVPYGKLSPLYIGGIIDAYLDYEERVEKRIIENKKKHDREIELQKEALNTPTPVEGRIYYLNYYFTKIQESYNFVTDFKGIAFEVFSRSGIRFDLSEYDILATQLVEKDNLKAKNAFEKMIEPDPATIEKYQKWLCMKDVLKLETPLQFISKLTEQQLMGE